MRILVVNSSDSGHHLEYKAMLNKALIELGHEVFNFNQVNHQPKQTKHSVQTLQKKNGFISRANLTLVFKHLKNRRKALMSLHQINDNIKQLDEIFKKPDFVFFACFDAYVNHNLTQWDINRKLKIPFSGILFYPADTRLLTLSCMRKGPFDPYQLLKNKNCRSIGLLVEDAINLISTLSGKPVYALPDITTLPPKIPDNSIRKLILYRASSRLVIGLFGSLELRKGVSEFLQMALKLPSDKFFFVIGGRPHVKAYSEADKITFQKGISGHIENLIIDDRWLTDDEFYSGIHACDLIIAAYPDWKFSSGIIGKAAAVGVPVLVNDGYVMAKRVKDFDIGFIKDPMENLTAWILENKDMIKSLKKSENFKLGCIKYCERFGYDQWRKSLEALLNQ